MHPHILSRATITSIVFALVVAASSCKPHSEQTASVPVLRVTTSDFSFEAPAQVGAGLVTIEAVNHGQNLHEVQLIRLGPGKTAKDFADGLGNPGMSAWVSSAGGVAALMSGDSASVTQVLQPGNYVLVCGVPDSSGTPHMMRGMVRGLTVAPSSTSASAGGLSGIHYDETISLTEFAFTLTPAFTAGRHTMLVANHGTMPHSMVLLRLAPGATTSTALQWGQKQIGTPPFRSLGGVASLPAGAQAVFTADLTPGTYSLICFEQDDHDGKMHLAKGMTKEFTVT